MQVTLKCTLIKGVPEHVDDKGRSVKGNQTTHKPGDVIDLAKDEAERLIAMGHATRGAAAEAAPEAPAKPKKLKGDALNAAIADAIGQLDLSEGSEDLTAGGKPVVAAIEKRLGYDITADERDAGFEAFKGRDPKLNV